jgi:peptidoglycan/LPS O-acetylase OafA/YrhL
MPGVKPTEIKALSGARALPPLVLVLFHFSEGHGYRGWWVTDLVICRGYLWVEFFFVLSGFILTHVYGERVREFWHGKAYPRFMEARLIRLYPVHLAMLLVVLAIVWAARLAAHWGGYVSIYDLPYHVILDWKSFVASLFLVQAWNLFDFLSWNGVAWFVSVEFLLCLLFPIYLWLAGGRQSPGSVWRGLALIAAGTAGLAILLATAKHGLDITYHNGIFRGMSDFAIGVGMAVLYRAVMTRKAKPLPTYVHSLTQAVVVFALFYALYHTGWGHNRMDGWTLAPTILLIWVLAFDRGVVAWIMQRRWVQILGGWSYAIYMGQTAWLQGIRIIEQRLYPPPDTMVFGMRFADLIWWPEPIALVLVCIGWGALLAVLVEHPAARALKGYMDKRRTRWLT